MRRRGISRIKMLAIVMVAVVVLAVLGYVIHTNTVVGCLGCSGSRADLATVSGSIAAPSAYGVSQLNIQVKNTASDPIWTIEVTNSSRLPGSTYIAFYHNAGIVSAANALSVGQTATGSTSVRNVTAGTTYTLIMKIIFSTGGNQTQTLEFTAES